MRILSYKFIPILYLCSSYATAQSDVWIDTANKLIWQRCALGQQLSGNECLGERKELDYFQINKAVLDFREKSKNSNWRLPTASELASIRICSLGWGKSFSRSDEVSYYYTSTDSKLPEYCLAGSKKPTLDSQIFSNAVSDVNGWYWAEKSENDSNTRTAVNFNFGGIDSLSRQFALYVRLVKDFNK